MRHERKFAHPSLTQLTLFDLVPNVKRQDLPPHLRFQKMLKPTYSGCVEFTGAIDHRNGGYGRFRVAGQVFLAHRYAFSIVYGEVPPLLRHTCHNPRCCNIFHLRSGTHAQNAQDRIDAGRARSALKKEQVELIIRFWKSGKWSIDQLADHFNVGRKSIHSLLSGRTWSKVTGIVYEPAKPHQRFKKVA